MIIKQETESKPIDQFPDGSTVRIIHLNAGKGALSKLCALGLVPGTIVRVFINGKGPLKLRFRDTDLVIGRKFAEKILVRLVDDND